MNPVFWHAANCAMSGGERLEFNRFIERLNLAGSRLADEAHGLPDEARFECVNARVADVVALIRQIPFLIDDRSPR